MSFSDVLSRLRNAAVGNKSEGLGSMRSKSQRVVERKDIEELLFHFDRLDAALAELPAKAVPEKKKLPDVYLADYHEAIGWNACIDAMLASAPAPAASPVVDPIGYEHGTLGHALGIPRIIPSADLSGSDQK